MKAKLARGHLAGPQEEAQLWQSDALGGLELLRAHYVDFRFRPHWHAQFMIAVTVAGAGRPRFLGAEHLVGPGDLIVLNPGEIHEGGPAPDRTWYYRALYPPPELMAQVASELTGKEAWRPGFPGGVVQDPWVAGLLLRAHRTLARAEGALAGETHLLEAFAGLIERHSMAGHVSLRIGQEPRAVRLARDYLHAHPDENVSLARLAEIAGLTPLHLARVFRRETGLPPHGYQLLVRVHHAKALMADGFPIAQAAVAAGFFDQAHLTRHFKRIFGVTPGNYLAVQSRAGTGRTGRDRGKERVALPGGPDTD